MIGGLVVAKSTTESGKRSTARPPDRRFKVVVAIETKQTTSLCNPKMRVFLPIALLSGASAFVPSTSSSSSSIMSASLQQQGQ
jgi:hypothetical protein